VDTITRLFARLVVTIREDVGSVATEYGRTLSLIALAIILAATAVRPRGRRLVRPCDDRHPGQRQLTGAA
jgi:Flp pilus assembly pilin Flp